MALYSGLVLFVDPATRERRVLVADSVPVWRDVKQNKIICCCESTVVLPTAVAGQVECTITAQGKANNNSFSYSFNFKQLTRVLYSTRYRTVLCTYCTVLYPVLYRYCTSLLQTYFNFTAVNYNLLPTVQASLYLGDIYVLRSGLHRLSYLRPRRASAGG